MIVRVFFSKYGLVPCTYTNVTIKIQFFRAGKSGFRMWISGPSIQKSLQKSNFFSTGGAPAHENKKQKRKVNIAKKIKSQNPSCVAARRRRRQIRTGRSATAEGAGTTTAGGVQGRAATPGRRATAAYHRSWPRRCRRL